MRTASLRYTRSTDSSSTDMVTASWSERKLQSEVEALAKLAGWLYFHVYDSRRSAYGFPDVVLLRPPYLIFAELKSARGKLTAHQKLWARLLRLVPGVEYYEWRPADWDAIIERLTRKEPEWKPPVEY